MRPRKMLMLLMVLPFVSTSLLSAMPEKEDPSSHSLNICCSPELLELGNQWVSLYTTLYPEAEVQLAPLAESGLNSLIGEKNYLALLSKKELSQLDAGKNRIITIGKDVIVPVMSEQNPFKEEILEQGISPEVFSQAFSDEGILTWGSVLNNGNQNAFVTVRNEEDNVSLFLSDFLRLKEDQIGGVASEGTLNYIRSHPNAIGFCRLADVMGKKGEALIQGLSLVPIDVNGNKYIDPFEDIYRSTEDLLRGIWIGKYPKTLYSKLYAITDPGPLSSDETAFLSWIVSEGQEQLIAYDYLPVTNTEIRAAGQLIAKDPTVVLDVQAAGSSPWLVLMIIGVLGIGFLVFLGIPRVTGKHKSPSDSIGYESRPALGMVATVVPGGLFFDKSHTWAFMEKEGQVRVGINDFLQKVTGPITRVILKQPGDQVKKGETFLTLVQNGKKLEIQSPVSGVVVGANPGLEHNSSLLNSAPYAEGWIYMVEAENWLKEMKAYVMGEQYISWIKKELVRLKDFLSSGISVSGKAEPIPVLQDGGEIGEGVLEGFGPEVWEEFQTSFIKGNN